MNDHRFDPDVPDGSDTRRNNGFPMRPTLNGIDLEAWIAEHGRLTPTVPVLDGPATERPAAFEERWPTLQLIGLAEALDVVEAVAASNQAKHPGGKWQGQSREFHVGKSLAHAGRALHGDALDPETELPHVAHAVLRLLMSLGLELGK